MGPVGAASPTFFGVSGRLHRVAVERIDTPPRLGRECVSNGCPGARPPPRTRAVNGLCFACLSRQARLVGALGKLMLEQPSSMAWQGRRWRAPRRQGVGFYFRAK